MAETFVTVSFIFPLRQFATNPTQFYPLFSKKQPPGTPSDFQANKSLRRSTPYDLRSSRVKTRRGVLSSRDQLMAQAGYQLSTDQLPIWILIHSIISCARVLAGVTDDCMLHRAYIRRRQRCIAQPADPLPGRLLKTLLRSLCVLPPSSPGAPLLVPGPSLSLLVVTHQVIL